MYIDANAIIQSKLKKFTFIKQTITSIKKKIHHPAIIEMISK